MILYILRMATWFYGNQHWIFTGNNKIVGSVLDLFLDCAGRFYLEQVAP